LAKEDRRLTLYASLRELRLGRPNARSSEGCPAEALAKADNPFQNPNETR
jgi:hypothetical protein